MELKAEKNVPLPVAKASGVSAFLKTLKVGESVLVPGLKINNADAAVKYAGLQGRAKCRTMDGGVRIWRIK